MYHATSIDITPNSNSSIFTDNFLFSDVTDVVHNDHQDLVDSQLDEMSIETDYTDASDDDEFFDAISTASGEYYIYQLM